jgi:hypothetical protein
VVRTVTSSTTPQDRAVEAAPDKPQPHETLTVLFLAQDVNRYEIARRQRIHRSSVDNRVSKLLRRYKLGTAAALVALFLKNGWIRLEDV